MSSLSSLHVSDCLVNKELHGHRFTCMQRRKHQRDMPHSYELPYQEGGMLPLAHLSETPCWRFLCLFVCLFRFIWKWKEKLQINEWELWCNRVLHYDYLFFFNACWETNTCATCNANQISVIDLRKHIRGMTHKLIFKQNLSSHTCSRIAVSPATLVLIQRRN